MVPGSNPGGPTFDSRTGWRWLATGAVLCEPPFRAIPWPGGAESAARCRFRQGNAASPSKFSPKVAIRYMAGSGGPDPGPLRAGDRAIDLRHRLVPVLEAQSSVGPGRQGGRAVVPAGGSGAPGAPAVGSHPQVRIPDEEFRSRFGVILPISPPRAPLSGRPRRGRSTRYYVGAGHT